MDIQLVVFIGILAIDIFIVARTLLILMGRLKGTVLEMLGRYGDEPLFYPLSNIFAALLRIVLWMFLLSGGQKDARLPLWLFDLRLMLLAFTILLLSYLQTPVFRLLKRYFPKQARTLLWLLAYYPSWYRDLYERTSRYERRRIAYMWLCMPHATRYGFDYHTPSFLQWSDFVIMGAVMEEDEPVAVQVPIVRTALR